jgi:hypothetical protein
VPVLEHEEHRPPPAHGREQVGHRRVEAVALGVGVRLDGLRAHRQLRQQPRQLSAGRAERGLQLLRVDLAGEVVERLHERPVRRVHDRVARAVEHERAAGRRLAGELAHEPALARARLAADDHHPAALPLRPGHQAAERGQLARAPDERERRRVGQGSGELHSQI